MPRYRFLNEQGDNLGLFQTATHMWAPGDRIPRGRGDTLVVVNLTVALDGDDVDGYLVVKAADRPPRPS